MVPIVAKAMGLDTSTERSLWRDRALVELNRAVLWSFDRAGARISDHHTESRHFISHCTREERAGRPVPADWTWIVPPISGGATPVFHRYYEEFDLRPNFYLDAEAATLASTGRPVLARPAPRPSPRLPQQHGRGSHGPANAHPGAHNHPQPAICPNHGAVPTPRLPLRPAYPRTSV